MGSSTENELNERIGKLQIEYRIYECDGFNEWFRTKFTTERKCYEYIAGLSEKGIYRIRHYIRKEF